MFSKMLFTALLSVALASTSLAWTTPVPVSELNTLAGEGWPCISTDGLTMYFDRFNTSDHYWIQIYQAKRTSTSEAFTNVTRILAYNGHCVAPWISSDNLRLYYYRTEPGSIWRLKVSTRTTTLSTWTEGQNISELNTLGNVGYAKLSDNELSVVFNVFNGQTATLYAANRISRTSAFTNIHRINELYTGRDSRAAQLSDDGLTLYFTRNDNGVGHNYKATRPTTTSAFGTPEILNYWPDGYGIGCFSADGHTAYLGYNSDIYISYNNTAPTANAGDDQVVYAGIDGSAKVTLDGSDSNDPQNDELEYTWSYTVNGQVCEANGVKPTLDLPAGTYTITLVVNDGEFDSQIDEVMIEVVAPLKVAMKLSPILHSPSAKLFVARFNFPKSPVGKIEPYSIALAADPNITADYIDLTVHKESILNCNIAFESVSIPSGLLTPGKKVVIFGYFKDGRLFYGEDRLVRVFNRK